MHDNKLMAMHLLPTFHNTRDYCNVLSSILGAVSISSQQSLSDLPYKDYVAAFGRFFCVGFSVRDNIRKAVFDLK